MKTKLNDELIDFLNFAHNEYLACYKIKDLLIQDGFIELKENEKWNLKENSKYFVSRNSNSLIAFTTPFKFDLEKFYYKIISSHLDSPALKLKENPAVSINSYEKWKVEVYGGLINQSYVDRPLGVAGRIIVKKDNKLITKIVDTKKAVAIVPNVAIHQNRNINNGFVYNPQVDLLPLVGTTEEKNKYFNKMISSFLNKDEVLVSYDLYLYNFDKAQYIGIDDDFVCGQKEDDISAGFLSLKGLLDSKINKNDKAIKLAAFFDNEETGSLSFSGADSDLLRTALKRIAIAFKVSEESFLTSIKRSFVLSADNGHAIHPNHPELSDDKNICKVNKGLLLKFNSNMAYTSDAFTSSFVKSLCEENKIPYQVFFNRSDVRGGSTLGNISISQESILTCDIGLPQLAMHSSFETLGSEDTKAMYELMKVFYETPFTIDNDVVLFEKFSINKRYL